MGGGGVAFRVDKTPEHGVQQERGHHHERADHRAAIEVKAYLGPR